jgi:predicted DNA-binding protein
MKMASIRISNKTKERLDCLLAKELKKKINKSKDIKELIEISKDGITYDYIVNIVLDVYNVNSN